MKYWVYINDKVVGPYEEDKLAELDGFTPETLICETGSPDTTQEWVKASNLFDFATQSTPAAQEPISNKEESNSFFASSQINGEGTLTNALLAKIDKLMNEIEGMKGKLDDAIAASSADRKAVSQQLNALSGQQIKPSVDVSTQTNTQVTPFTQTPAAQEEPLQDTAQQTQQTEQIDTQTTQENTQQSADLLDEIKIGEKEDLVEVEEGEEVILRSALDSLYNVQEPVEEEKEATFQDLLSPIDLNLPQQNKQSAEQPAPENQAEAQPAAAQPAEQEAAPAEVSEEQREKIIDEITTPTVQEDAVMQAMEDQQQQPTTEEPAAEPVAQEEPTEEPAAQEEPAAEPVAQEEPTEEPAAQEEPAAEPVAQEEPTEEPAAQEEPIEQNDSLELSSEQEDMAETDLPETNENEPLENTAEESSEPVEDAPQDFASSEKESLDLGEIPQLSISENSDEDSTEPAPLQEQMDGLDSLDALQDQAENQDQVSQEPFFTENQQEEEKVASVYELVPGKELEKTQSDELISQKDLEAAFSNHEDISSEQADPFAMPEQQTLPANEEFYNPKEMTEVQLKEGSTYLISDFIPPEETGNKQEIIETFEKAQAEKEQEQKQAQENEATMIEIVPQQGAEAAEQSTDQNSHPKTEDLEFSQIKLENTIKTKRGATMDIKTVPMVKDPAASGRLDLSDSDLDLSAQHDLKAADFEPAKGGLLKGIMSLLASVILLGVIYFMLSYLDLIPAKYNLIKAQKQEEVMPTEEILDEQTVPVDQSAATDQDTAEEAQPVDPMTAVLNEVKGYELLNGQTLEQLISSRHLSAGNMIEWNVSSAVEPDNYSVLVKVPPENAQGFKISYRFNYNMITKDLEPTISDAKNLLDSANK